MSRRSRAREIVLQILFQDDLNADSDDLVRLKFVRGRLKDDPNLVKFANELIEGVRARRDEIDELLDPAADNWRLSRMAVTDRNIMRLGIYEIMFTDTPDPVAVNEAIELAKRYGTNNSAQFVNGVLDRLIKSKSIGSTSKSNTRTDEVPDNSDVSDLKLDGEQSES